MMEQNSLAVAMTRQLVQIDSTDPGTYEGNIGEFIYGWLSKLPGVTLCREEVLPGRFNLKAELGGKDAACGAPALVFICHMDTVVIGDNWTREPFSAEEENGRIYGRGSCDMKSGLSCALSAFSDVSRQIAAGRIPARRLVLICSVDEEDFMRGSEAAIRSGWVSKEDWILDTEPTDGQIQVAHKGRTWFELTVHGCTAHASTPWKGADAIAGMAEIIRSVRLAIAAAPPHHDLGVSTVTFGQINGGYRPYVVPDLCKVWIDMRLVPPTDTAAASAILDKAVKDAQAAVPGITVSCKLTGDRPYIEKNEASPLLSHLKRACLTAVGSEAPVGPFPGYTDTAVIAGTLKNKNCMSYGPGSLEMAHKPDEYVPISDILRCEKVLICLAHECLFD